MPILGGVVALIEFITGSFLTTSRKFSTDDEFTQSKTKKEASLFKLLHSKISSRLRTQSSVLDSLDINMPSKEISKENASSQIMNKKVESLHENSLSNRKISSIQNPIIFASPYLNFATNKTVIKSINPEKIKVFFELLKNCSFIEELKIGMKFVQELEKNNFYIKFSHARLDLEILFFKESSKIPNLKDFISARSLTIFSYENVSRQGLYCASFKNKDKERALLEEAEHAIQNRHFSPCSYSLKGESANDLISEIYTHFDGLCIGELHDQIASKKWIMDNIDSLKNRGVTTLFLEHLFYDTMQPLLDDYFASKEDEMPQILESSLSRLNVFLPVPHCQSFYSYSNLVRIAKKAEIRTVAIDTSVSYGCGYSSWGGAHGEERYKAMNYVAEKIIRHEKRERKFICLIGSAHGTAYPTQGNYPGIAEFLECPFIVIENASEKSPPAIHRHVQSLHETGIYAHALIFIKN